MTNETGEAFMAATLLSIHAASVADALRTAAALEADPSVASKMLARAAIVSLVPALATWSDEIESDVALWCLAVCGRLLADPVRLAALAPDLMGGV